MRTLQVAQSSDVGFDSKNLIVLSMDVSALGYDDARVTTLRAQLAERLKTMPEIKEVSSAQIMPFAGRRDDAIDIEGGVRRALEPARTGAWFSGTIGLLALIIAATGIYGMLSYNVVERTSEIGIRMALGAQRRSVLLLIVGDGMKLTAIGTAIGLAIAFALSRVLRSAVFGVVTTDALAFAAVAIGALVVALLACYIPAYRATKVDPLIALRRE